MDLYLLDNVYRRVQIVDKYESLIWTERFSSMGDFELKIPSTIQNRARFAPGILCSIDDSYRVMTVDTVTDGVDEEGRKILTITGLSLENVLNHRLVMIPDEITGEWLKWISFGTPDFLAEELFFYICQEGVLNSGDIIPGVLTTNVIFPEDTITPPEEEIDFEVDPKSLYVAIKELCDAYGMGFRLVKSPVSSQLYFNIYMGSDRTTSQSTLPAVIFSPDLDNLENTKAITTTAMYKNVAYVVSPVGHEIVYDLDVDPLTEGFERRVLYVNADDIEDTDPGIATARMIQRGKDELAKNRRFSGFDGEVSQFSKYKYGQDYHLGDLVELRNNVDGGTSIMQVTEQIFVSDKEGKRSYPTLSVNNFITPGTWSSWDYNQVWDDFTDEVWDDLPE